MNPAPSIASGADERSIEATTSLCPECLQRVDARIVVRGGSVYLRKRCPIHGEQWALLEKNAAYYLARGAFDKPGTASKTQTQSARGCPFDCGLCPNHQQHTCIGLIEVTQRCNLDCPECYAHSTSASPAPGDPQDPSGQSLRGPWLTLEQAERMMDFFQEAESGRAEVLQLSGGEPTLHPQILELLRLAKTKGFKFAMLNTNGLRLATDEPFVRALGELAGGFEVYLQFDSFEPAACIHLRGRDLLDLKRQAIERLERYHVPTTLVATVKRDVNDHELGRLLEFGLNAGCVRGINFQPMAFFSGGKAGEAGSRTTVTDILERLEEQTRGRLRLSDFVPLPCDVERVAITYLYRSNGQFTPVTRGADLRSCLPAIPNTFAFEADDFVGVPSAPPHGEKRVGERREVPGPGGAGEACDCAAPLLKWLRPLIPKSYAKGSLAEKIAHVSRNTFRVSVSSFVDPYNFDLKSMQRECVHVLTPGLRRVPFSAYNMFHRVHD